MSLSILDRGHGHLRLVRDGREVGLVDGRTIRFHGFADADSARAAATAAYDALTEWIADQRGTEALPRRRPFAVRREGALDWLTLGGARVGRLLRARAAEVPGLGRDVGFEVYLPPQLAGRHAGHAAQVVDRAVRRLTIAPARELAAAGVA